MSVRNLRCFEHKFLRKTCHRTLDENAQRYRIKTKERALSSIPILILYTKSSGRSLKTLWQSNSEG